MIAQAKRIVAVSNRMPISLSRDGSEWVVKPGSGGLVTAMAPVLRNRGGVWVGWPGTSEHITMDKFTGAASQEAGYDLRPVALSTEQVEGYYYGFANRVVWPLFHDLQTMCDFNPDFWRSYIEVNGEFAKAIEEYSDPSDYVWVHDYHLMYVRRAMREMEIKRQTGFFLHIPFPPVDIFLKLPWRAEILRALLEYDLIGFQTMRDRRNFTDCVRLLLPEAHVSGRGPVVTVSIEGQRVQVGAFAIGIDFNEFAVAAGSNEVAERAWYFHESLPNRTIILGVDRLDYTKGIPERLEAMRLALERYPQLQQNVTLVELVVPSREEVPEYAELKAQIERQVGEINGQFTTDGWVPIHYMYRSLPREELVAYYRAAEIGFLTPLKDGMNLVSKEYCACNLEGNGVLILSEFAGATAQLQKGALLVNPYDIEGVADTIYRAVTMDKEERYQRMRRMRESVRRYNIYWWVDSFLQTGFGLHLSDFPTTEEYFPAMEEQERAE